MIRFLGNIMFQIVHLTIRFRAKWTIRFRTKVFFVWIESSDIAHLVPPKKTVFVLAMSLRDLASRVGSPNTTAPSDPGHDLK